jgi:cytochrome c553
MAKFWMASLLFLCWTTVALADEARDIWAAKCKLCHGEDGRAKTKTGKKEKIPEFTSPKWQARHSDSFIKKTIQNGSEDNPKMKPFKDKLTEQEIDSLVLFIRAFKANPP